MRERLSVCMSDEKASDKQRGLCLATDLCAQTVRVCTSAPPPLCFMSPATEGYIRCCYSFCIIPPLSHYFIPTQPALIKDTRLIHPSLKVARRLSIHPSSFYFIALSTISKHLLTPVETYSLNCLVLCFCDFNFVDTRSVTCNTCC